ncbi:MAG: HAD family hydrolase [Liquorilactobacillus hordei]|uniref:HAD family hydrolase n=1 Tax=Liquorilactobacillus hordei TaxID=468911 RepID=UPI0039ED0117
MIKLFASDLDGTLLKNGRLDEVVFETINKVLEQNKVFVIATGRLMFEEHIKSMKLDQYDVFVICLNGALVFDSKRNEIYKKQIDSVFLKNVLSEFQDIPFEFITTDKILIQQSKEKFREYVRDNELRSKKLPEKALNLYMENCRFKVSLEEIIETGVLKINGHINDKKRFRNFRLFLDENAEFVENCPFENNDFFEITDSSVNKGNSLLKLIDYLGVSENEVAVYGDGPNDMKMLKMFKNSFAPKNATREVLEVASKIVGACDEHGVPKHINKLITTE